MNLRDVLEREILPRVEKPSRYLGTELNAVHKRADQVELRLALVFPDLYDLGLGNLGVHILYAILNRQPWCWAERAYAPGLDLERELRARELPLFAWESKDGLGEMDGIGFTLQSELTFTNILNVIDLAGLPLRTSERAEHHPLTFAGGPAVFNPEPLAPFMDFFVIGDGEDVVIEIAECLRAARGETRAAKLERLAAIEGVYVPALYPMETLADGRVLPPVDGPKIVKRTVKSLDGATFPTDYIVPYTQQVHDRVSLEVLRGCTQGCRFCQAGMTTRPVRERSLEKVDELMQRTLDNTGYEEVSLVSLSTCDYSKVRTLVDQAADRAARDHVSVSLPSLRLDSFSVDLADRVADVRRSGLTVAPEAASPRLRALINKWIPDDDLLRMADEVYAKGWSHVKLYFMIGLPTERDDDIEAIADLTLATLERGRKQNGRARVNTGVSTFVPKPFTPFQWAEQISPEEAERRQRILGDRFRKHRSVKFGRHHAEETWLEGLVSRADRRAADLIEAAFRKGARFDAWDEHRDGALWRAAIEETGFDAAAELRARELDERLPWDHIDILIPKAWFVEDWRRAVALEHAPDCRHSRCHDCGVIDRERPLCVEMLRKSRKGAKAEVDYTPPPRVEVIDPDPVQRLRMRIGRRGEVRFLSHLETMNAWIRAFRRAKIPVAYSQGFHAHARIAFSAAPPVGEASTAEYLDVLLTERVDPAEAVERLRAVLPEGLEIYAADEIERAAPSLMSQVRGASYALFPADETAGEELARRVAAVTSAERLPVRRLAKSKGRKQEVEVDVRPMIRRLSVEEGAIALDTTTVDGRSLKPRELIELLGLDPASTHVVKTETHLGA